MKTSTCKSCGATIVWAITATGARMPVDAVPLRAFTLIETNESAPSAQSTLVYHSHFATCPDADQHRRG